MLILSIDIHINFVPVIIKDKPTALSATTKTFGFDRVFGPASKQVDVHKAVVGPLIKQTLQVCMHICSE